MNIGSFRLPASWDAGISAAKVITEIPIRKPKPGQWFRVRPGDEWVFDTILYKDEDGDTYIVAPLFHQELLDQNLARPSRIYMLILYGSSSMILSDIPLTLPGEKPNLWHDSRMRHYETAKEEWIRISANRTVGGYEIYLPDGNLVDPEWSDKPENMEDVLTLAFKERIIDSDDHPVLNRLRGRA